MFAKFDEIPAMTLQDIKETKCYGRTHTQRENNIQTKFGGGGGGGTKSKVMVNILELQTLVACHPRQSGQTQISLLLKKQSDLGIHCPLFDKHFVSSKPENQQFIEKCSKF